MKRHQSDKDTVMNEKTYLEWDEALAAVKYNGRWRFFHDIEVMFILDYPAYDDTCNPAPGEFRYGTLVVNEDNAVEWMNSLSGELSLEQLPHTYWRGTGNRVQLTL
jgi:hypothetical protein